MTKLKVRVEDERVSEVGGGWGNKLPPATKNNPQKSIFEIILTIMDRVEPVVEW